MRGLFVGRFQPFHNGHLKALEWILGKCNELIVLIGSSQRCYEPEHLFTIGERMEMIFKALRGKGLADRCLIIPIPDIQNNALWVSHIDSLVPAYDVVYSNNALVRQLFEDAGKKVVEIPFFDRHKNDGTKIRELMLKDGKWKALMPKEVAEFIEKIGGVERLKAVSKGDKY